VGYLQIPLLDLETQDIIAVLPKCFDFIDIGREAGGVVVHWFVPIHVLHSLCSMAGQSRSVAVIIAYLMARLGMSYDDAYQHVKAAKDDIYPNTGFVR